MPDLPQLTPREFVERWPEFPQAEVTLLDVREPHELAVAAVSGSLNIPMGAIEQRLSGIPPGGPTVVMCHGGIRSSRVAEFLLARGFTDVYNLTGGINAWSLEVDPAVPTY